MDSPARRSSDIYEVPGQSRQQSRQTLDSQPEAPLTANAAPPAGGETSESKPENDTQNAPAAAAAAPKVPFYKKKWFWLTQLVIVPFGIALLFILLFPIVRAIVQSVVTKTTLGIDEATILNPANDTFTLQMKGQVYHTGIFSAWIEFQEPIQISWLQDNGTSVPLGTITLDKIYAKNKRATIDQTTTFTISDEDKFGDFTQYMITAETFTWRLYSNKLRAQALKFPVAHGITFDKHLTLNGMKSFDGNVKLQDLQLPSDNDNGINFEATTQLNNPSAFHLNLGTVEFALSYDGLDLGTGTQDNTVIVPGSSNQVALKGFLKRQEGDENLSKLSQLFTNYINADMSTVKATGLSTRQPDGTQISWLSKGLQALTLSVPFVPEAAINPIKGVSIGAFALQFFTGSPGSWTPTANSDSVTADLELPFGFSLSISEIANEFDMVMTSGDTFAKLSTPSGASKSNISTYAADNTKGTIDISIVNTNLSSAEPQHKHFSAFNTLITDKDLAEFSLIGNSSAIANMSVGVLKLDPIKVNVTTSLQGLRGLNDMVKINSVDVTGGTKDAIVLDIDVTINNPSNLWLNVDDLNLALFRGGSPMGTTLLPNLTLNMGANNVAATGYFQANDNADSLQTLNDFVGKRDVVLSIGGYDDSTQVHSLARAFRTLSIDTTLPALKTDLLDTAALKVPSTIGQSDNISQVTVDLANPFSADLRITSVASSIKSLGLDLGTIDMPTDFSAAHNATTTSQELDLNLNMDPETLFTLTRALAVEAGLETVQLDGIVALGGYEYLFTTDNSSSSSGDSPSSSSNKNSKRDNIYTGFELPPYVQQAFKQLHSDVSLTAGVTIGEYETHLTYAQQGLPTKTDDSLDYLLPILARPIVEKIVDGAALGIETVLITDPKEDMFTAALVGSITNAGPFDAVISFGNGLSVKWNGKELGNIKMDNVSITGDVGGDINVTSSFQTLITEESFDWEISGEGLVVSALGITVDGISLNTKKVTLKGMNGLRDGVTINSFDLPSNDDNGGIHLTIDATAKNPSQVGVELSTLSFDSYTTGDNAVMIAPVSTNETVTLYPQSSTNMVLVGRLIPQDSDEGLAAVSGVFNNFIHGKNSDLVVQGAAAGPSDVSWLNEGIKSLKVETELPNQGKLDIIKSIVLNQLTLMFDEDSAWAPPSSTNDTEAAFTIPFAFPIDIVALQETITIGWQGTDVGQLKVDKSPTTTDIDARVIYITFKDTPLTAYDDKHDAFSQFLAATTTGETVTLSLSGTSNADASTAVGVLSLKDIDFSVSTDIGGLQGLNAKPVTVGNLDVKHGYSDYLLITLDGDLYNPSNLTVGTGDVAFTVQYQDRPIGEADIADLVITPGNLTTGIDFHYQPEGDAAEGAGRNLLENYIQGVDSDTVIQGSTESTDIESLQSALSEIRLAPVTIPALHQTLVTAASLKFPVDIVDTGIASATVDIANPFTASINLLTVDADVKYRDLSLGSVDHQDFSSNPIHADGHSNVTSQDMQFDFNLNPATIIQLLLQNSEANGVDLGPLPDLFQFVLDNPDFDPPVKSKVDTDGQSCHSGNQFDVQGAILSALKNLNVNLSITTDTSLDDYATQLSFMQYDVPAITDETALYLIGAVAAPIAQHLVDGANVSFTEANITNISNDGFDLALLGSLTNIGPLDAQITFTEPLTITWNDNKIAEIDVPDVCAGADEGVPNWDTSATLHITDQGAFTDFTKYILHNEDFTWTLSTDKLRVEALDTIFDGISMSKDITLKAFNGLPGVSIGNFELPSDDPDGGIHMELDVVIPSPAQLGIDLGTVSFKSLYKNVNVGPLSGEGLVLAPQSKTTKHMAGRITPKSDDELDTIGDLFTRYLQAENISLTAQGDTVMPDGSNEIEWLSDAFKTLELEVTLQGESFDIIQSISIDDLEVTMESDDQTWAPASSSKKTNAVYKNPFGFSLQVIRSAETLNIGYGGSDAAKLEIPMADADGEASTGNDANLPLSFKDIPMVASDHGAFQSMFGAVTLKSSADLALSGAADVVAATSIGNVPISNISFDVTTSLGGINGFGGKADLGKVSVVGSGGDGNGQYIRANTSASLENPSNVSLKTNDIELPVIWEGIKLGRAVIDPFDLEPGKNTYPSEFRYMPDDANDTKAMDFLNQFITTEGPLAVTIDGDTQSTPHESLATALDGIQISSAITGLNKPTLITHINVYISLGTIFTSEVEIDFDVYNPMEADLVIEVAQADAYVKGDQYAKFTEPYDSFVVSPGQTGNSGRFGHVLLTKGALGSLGIIPLGYLDIKSAITARVDAGGYQIPWLHVDVDHVPTEYHLSLGLDEFEEKAKEAANNATSAAGSLVSGATSAAGSVISEVTSGAGSVVSHITSDAGSAVSHITSAAGSIGDEATSAAGSAWGEATSAVGGIFGGDDKSASPTATASTAHATNGGGSSNDGGSKSGDDGGNNNDDGGSKDDGDGGILGGLFDRSANSAPRGPGMLPGLLQYTSPEDPAPRRDSSLLSGLLR
ncbi:hypothetical protein EV715DRAFT_290908 [Schizophyllum commune]